MNARKNRIVLVILALLTCTARTYAEPNAPAAELTPYQAVQQGNDLYGKGEFSQALETYESAQSTELDAPVLMYNRANTLYRLEQFDRAADLYGQVSARSKDIDLVTGAKFNLGNTHYTKALSLLNDPGEKSPDLKSVLDELVAAVRYYREVLDINPADVDAAHNIAVARLTMKDILDQIKKQAEQQQRQEQNRELAEKIKKLLERQIETLQQTAALPQDVPPGPTTEAAQVQAETAKLAPQQQQLSDDTTAVRDEVNEMLDQAPPPPANPDPCTVDPAQADRMMKQTVAAELTNATEKQDNAVVSLNDQQVAPAVQAEASAAEHLKRALEALGQPQQQEQQEQDEQDQSEDQEQEKEQDSQQPSESDDEQEPEQQQELQAPEMPDTTAQDILDKEKERNEKRRAVQLRGYRPVEKDW